MFERIAAFFKGLNIDAAHDKATALFPGTIRDWPRRR